MMLLGVIASSIIKLIKDTFTRTTTGNLGTSDSGNVWTNLRGTWFANGTQAQSNDAASTYPIASVNAGSPNLTTSASVSSGTGIAFWIADSGSWWASTSYNNTSIYTYSCNPYTCTNINMVCNCVNGIQFNQNGVYPYAETCSNTCNRLCTTNGTTVSSFTCYDQTQSTCYNTCSGTNYLYYLRLTNSVVGTVTTSVVSDVALGSQPAAIKVITSGNTITAQAYSDTTLTTPLGSPISTTPTSPTKGNSVGIIVSPSSYNQQSVVDDFSSSM